MMMQEAMKSTSESGRLRSFITSFLLSACKRSMSFAFMIVREFANAAIRKMAANTASVFRAAAAEKPNTNPGTSTANSDAVR